MEAYAGQQFVGIDLHRRRSVIVRTTDCCEVLEAVRIVNDAERLRDVLARCGEDPEVVVEATYGGIGRRTCSLLGARGCIWRTRWE